MNTAKRRRVLATISRTGAVTTLAALTGSLASGKPENNPWFVALRKPAFQPPPIVFPVVWTSLYVDIAVCSAIALNELQDNLQDNSDNAQARKYARVLSANLVMNSAWTWVFFHSRRLAAAPALAATLAISSADLALRSYRARRATGLALAPYAVWCGFATTLSTAIWRLNRGR